MPGLARKIADRVGDMLGVHIEPKYRAGEWMEQSHLATLLETLEVDCVFDVGANGGQYGQSLRRLGYAGPILSFEPAPRTFARLGEAARSDPHWHIFNVALGRVEGAMPFHIMRADDLSSFHLPTASEEDTWSATNVVEETVEVPVRRLDRMFDELVEAYGFARPFLKMDTQGFDLQVLEGAEAYVDRFVGVSSEVAVKRLYEGSPHISESVAAISSMGFDFVGFYPVHPNRKLNPVEFNSYAVRRDLSR